VKGERHRDWESTRRGTPISQLQFRIDSYWTFEHLNNEESILGGTGTLSMRTLLQNVKNITMKNVNYDL